MLQPPPAEDYPTLEELLEAVQAHAAIEGYAVVRKRSKPGFRSNEIVKIALNCDRGGKARRKPGAKIRKTSSIKCGCPFRVNAIYKKSLDVWTVNVRNTEHNHNADDVPDSSAALRRTNKTAELLEHIDNATRSGNCCVYLSYALLTVK
jgi:hypothetical protein